jgi:hypothetical protein
MELNISELTLTSFNSIQLNLTELTAVNKLVVTVTMEHNLNPQFSKDHLTTVNLNNFKMTEGMELKNYCIEVPLNGITSIPNFMKIYNVVQKLLVGDTQTDKETGDFISLLSFLESRLKKQK